MRKYIPEEEEQISDSEEHNEKDEQMFELFGRLLDEAERKR